MRHLRMLVARGSGAQALETQRNLVVLFAYVGVAFLSVLGVLTLGLFWSLADFAMLLSDVPSKAQVVDLAGRQRMLSERLVKELLLSHAADDSGQRVTALSRAGAALAELRSVQDHLRSGALRFLPEEPVGGGHASSFDAVEQAFRRLEEASAMTLAQMGAQAGFGKDAAIVTRDLNTAAGAYQTAMSAHLERFAAAAAAHERRMKQQMSAILIAGYLAMFALAWPIMRRARRSVQDLARAVNDLKIEHEQRLRMRREYDRLVIALEQSPNAVLVCEADGTVTYANRGMERICPDHACRGFAVMRRAHRQKTPSVNLKDLCMVPPEVFGRLQETLAKGQVWRSHEQCRGTCGREMVVSALPIVEATGQISGSVAMIRDTTHERQMEVYLRESQKLEALGTLVGGVAHDFNNALQVISGYLELALRRSAEDKQLQEDLEQAARAARGASAVTRQLLAFARQQPPTREIRDLNELVTEHARMVRHVIRGDIRLEVTPAPAALPVAVDPGSLEQALLNLYLNAQDAMSSGGLLSITLNRITADDAFRVRQPWAAASQYATIRVRDEGAGMSPQVLARVFDPFFTTKEVGKGTGLGLTAVYGILRQHQGMVTVESAPGAGTTVTLYLPLNGLALPVLANGEVSPPPRGNETILVAEGDPAIRKLLTVALQSQGYRVLTAEDGESALSLASGETPVHLVVMDTFLLKLSALALFEALRARRPALPILATSGPAGEAVAETFKERGVPVLRKPHSAAALFKQIRELLNRAGGPDESAS
jgi:signal transduction histidine kinase/ActR/RegA family two-component response regulator